MTLPTAPLPCDARTRVLLLAVRQGLIIILGAIEDHIGVPRSIIPKHKREGET